MAEKYKNLELQTLVQAQVNYTTFISFRVFVSLI
jgi:hypothetical protein